VNAKPVIMLAGGGTGGHVFPMVAVADALRAEDDVRIVYVGTPRGIEATIVPNRGDELELLDVRPIKGKGFVGAIRGATSALATLPRARSLVRRLGPRAVLSVGGYAAGPVGLAAYSCRVPLSILEPNNVLGLTNRWLAPFATKAYVAFPEVQNELRRCNAVVTGVPLRGAFSPRDYEPRADRFSVLVLGGSLGAAALNEVVPAALTKASRQIAGLSVLHQAGRGRDDAVGALYADLAAKNKARVVPFLDDVAGAIADADLVIGRAGASAVAELCAIGRPSILIPFPFAADDHQSKNAGVMADEGAAVCIMQSDATEERVRQEVVSLANSPDRRRQMAELARKRGRPDAAKTIAHDILVSARGGADV
jgi:UDP-N-acetylglucosamine--N-acetylmuramyl-(pentapeptide) pyrophosphoryl-undecaprenol N-acetylglucosamine transferase